VRMTMILIQPHPEKFPGNEVAILLAFPLWINPETFF